MIGGGHIESQSFKASAFFIFSPEATKNYNSELFLSDLMCDPFHLVNIFDEIDGQVDVFNELFLDTLSEHAPIKRIKIKSRPNPFITPEIKQLIKTCDSWQKKARKTNNKLH